MAKPTLLETVQTILTELNGDQVSSISDTQEATDVATIVRQVYFEITDELELPSNYELTALEGLADLTKPNYMRIPENVERIEWVKYDTRTTVSSAKDYTEIPYITPDEFINFANSRPSTDTTNYQIVYDSANLPLVIGKTDAPAYWTTFDDGYVVFDSYDNSVDSTLQSSKSMTWALIRPTFTIADSFVPDLPENMFNVLYIQSLNRCFASLRQTVNPKTERQESRNRVRFQRNKYRSRRRVMDWPDYGRKP